ncbi:tail assembly protein [Actinobacillus pleuropneumoniae]|uniref:tail assembly protein n=1 Tax=Actinobacillus pleuropneumoniae TaxID=715 RepID=UPI00032162AD|nr:tail assembly protein [Actinobacillus pleuropneumoniae]MEE3682403.1 tail assembly protein [Actinobacillus pleuropneumoniae]
MAKITFHGDLKRFIDESFELDVNNFRELMNGLLTQIQGFREHLRNGYYKVRIGKNYLNNDQLQTNPMIALDDKSSIHFTPVIAGAGKGMGIGQLVLGVVLVAAAFYTGGASLLAWSSGATMMGAMGASLILGGAISLLSKTPEMSSGVKEGEKKQSTSFSNIRNLTPQGRPIPLLYGRMLTSLVLISQGIETFDDVEELNR